MAYNGAWNYVRGRESAFLNGALDQRHATVFLQVLAKMSERLSHSIPRTYIYNCISHVPQVIETFFAGAYEYHCDLVMP